MVKMQMSVLCQGEPGLRTFLGTAGSAVLKTQNGRPRCATMKSGTSLARNRSLLGCVSLEYVEHVLPFVIENSQYHILLRESLCINQPVELDRIELFVWLICAIKINQVNQISFCILYSSMRQQQVRRFELLTTKA